jgi:hypothetical protein
MGALNRNTVSTVSHRNGGWTSLRNFARPVLLLLLLITGQVCHAQSAEQQIKAAFLYHFCSYVQWPQHTTADHAVITIGVVGTLKTIRLITEALGEKSHKKCTFHVRPIKPGDDLRNIQMLYVTQKTRFSVNDFHFLAQAPPILIITDEEKNSSRSMINFVIRNDQVRFVISKSQADQAGLKLSSELLAVALEVN